MKNQRNGTLEILKLFASYMIVFIHVSFDGNLGIIMDTLARFAVPFFFLISGFYSYQITPVKIKKRIRHIFNLLVFATISYTLFNIVNLLQEGNIDDVVIYFSQYADIITLIKLFIFNSTISGGHLWYLLALIYVYVVFYLVTVYPINEKVIFTISLLFLFIHLLLAEGISILGIELPSRIILRNFALMGIPFFVLGLYARKNEHKLRNIPNYVLIISVVIGVISSILSRFYFGENELFIGSLFILFSFVIISIKYSNIQYPGFVDTLSGCSTYIYILHIMVSSIMLKIYEQYNINYSSSIILKNIHPLLVCIVTTLLGYFITQIANKILPKKQK